MKPLPTGRVFAGILLVAGLATQMLFEENQKGIGYSILKKDGTVVTNKSPERVEDSFWTKPSFAPPDQPQRRKRTDKE